MLLATATSSDVSSRIVLDTNIISETLKPQPDDNVLAWLLQNEEHLSITAITIGELFYGAYRLPMGKRRENLLLALERIAGGYKKQVFPYDAEAAKTYAQLQEEALHVGRTLTVEDGMIAAICITKKARLATCNTKDFSYLELSLINPFEELSPDIIRMTL
jgi:predicted nucleic acid-binding protein